MPNRLDDDSVFLQGVDDSPVPDSDFEGPAEFAGQGLGRDNIEMAGNPIDFSENALLDCRVQFSEVCERFFSPFDLRQAFSGPPNEESFSRVS